MKMYSTLSVGVGPSLSDTSPRQLQNHALWRRRSSFSPALDPFAAARSRRSPTRRRALWSSFVFPVTLSPSLVSDSAMSREGSLTTVLCRFTATLPVEPTSGCRKTGHAVDYVQAYQPPKELSYQPTNSLFPSPGRPEFDIPLWFAPFKSYDTRSISFTRVNPSFIGISSFSPPLKVKLLSPAWILSSVDPLQRLRILSGVLSSSTEVQCRSGSGASLSTPTARSELSAQFNWAWPIWATKLNSLSLILPKFKVIEGMIRPLLVFDGWVSLSYISGGYTGNFSCCVMSYFSFGMILLVVSPGLVSISPSFSSEKCPVSPSILSMKGDVFLVSLPSISFSFFTGLLSCGAVKAGSQRHCDYFSVARLCRESYIDAVKCVAAAVSGRGGDPRVVRACRVIKSGFVGVERSALSLVSSEVEVIVRWAVGDNDKSRSEAPEVVGLMQAWCARFIVSSIEFS
ncbi:hypothetical protein YC2023_097721 [Brassica napus]